MKSNHLLALPCFALATLMLLPLQAAESSVVQALSLCQQEQDNQLRLHCYDSIQVDASEQGASTAAKQNQQARQPAAAATPAASAATAEDQFGKPRQAAANETDRIYSVVSKVEQDARGHLVIHFENGQTWRQNSSEYYPVKAGEEHYIRRAMLGSFILSNDDSNRSTRVRRMN
ncbi:hypothetical protein Q3O60_05640 [Alkalimonas collagenimarina]|uniref:Uncharacterized protein n=1 Tax=Alkalimonas collagenimarina TaxID=400390 RepID=A0ABT9GX88_9GAMM|nr:hypothetical protein [Alkalimonas collagenimarina]MDP4535661.1 hypothetical protein [Alkalimonas collagenimarina]